MKSRTYLMSGIVMELSAMLVETIQYNTLTFSFHHGSSLESSILFLLAERRMQWDHVDVVVWLVSHCKG